jgi:hypothetical protein
MLTVHIRNLAADCPRIGKNRLYFEGFWVDHIEEFNLLSNDGRLTRAYRIYWETHERNGVFDCFLNTEAYRRTVIPNQCKVVEMSEQPTQRPDNPCIK